MIRMQCRHCGTIYTAYDDHKCAPKPKPQKPEPIAKPLITLSKPDESAELKPDRVAYMRDYMREYQRKKRAKADKDKPTKA